MSTHQIYFASCSVNSNICYVFICFKKAQRIESCYIIAMKTKRNGVWRSLFHYWVRVCNEIFVCWLCVALWFEKINNNDKNIITQVMNMMNHTHHLVDELILPCGFAFSPCIICTNLFLSTYQHFSPKFLSNFQNLFIYFANNLIKN
jgi:hypothetical protein